MHGVTTVKYCSSYVVVSMKNTPIFFVYNPTIVNRFRKAIVNEKQGYFWKINVLLTILLCDSPFQKIGHLPYTVWDCSSCSVPLVFIGHL